MESPGAWLLRTGSVQAGRGRDPHAAQPGPGPQLRLGQVAFRLQAHAPPKPLPCLQGGGAGGSGTCALIYPCLAVSRALYWDAPSPAGPGRSEPTYPGCRPAVSASSGAASASGAGDVFTCSLPEAPGSLGLCASAGLFTTLRGAEQPSGASPPLRTESHRTVPVTVTSSDPMAQTAQAVSCSPGHGHPVSPDTTGPHPRQEWLLDLKRPS